LDEEGELESEGLARSIVDLVVDKLGEDVLLLDIRPVSTMTDFFVMCNGTTERQVEAIHEHILSEVKKTGARPSHREGTGASGWMLLDYGSVIVHIFLPVTRQYYSLERLWENAKTVLRIM